MRKNRLRLESPPIKHSLRPGARSDTDYTKLPVQAKYAQAARAFLHSPIARNHSRRADLIQAEVIEEPKAESPMLQAHPEWVGPEQERIRKLGNGRGCLYGDLFVANSGRYLEQADHTVLDCRRSPDL